MAALDVEIRDDLRTELARHLADLPVATVLVTHDAADLEALASDVVVLEAGRVSQRGGLAVLRAAPATPYVARLVR
jgi:molybdate transport system ATP-binding protein